MMSGKNNNLNSGPRQWSLRWIVLRTIAVIREGRLKEIRLSNVVRTYLHDRRVARRLKKDFPERYRVAKIYRSGWTGKSPAEDTIVRSDPSLPASPVNDFFRQVYVINLERRPDRKVAMIRKLRSLNISARIVNAFDGEAEEIRDEFRAYYERPLGTEGAHPLELAYNRKMIMSSGAWAYLKTCLKILGNAQEKGYEKILCLDDDVFFAKDFNQRFTTLVSALPEEWDLLYLGASQRGWDTIDRQLTGTAGNRPFYHPADTHGSFALGIHQRAFPLLINETERFNCSFDSGPLQAVSSKSPEDSYVAFPNLVVADVEESDIGPARQMAATAKDFRWDLTQYHYPFEPELVSVIMPAYNAEKTIAKSILSIQNQRYSNFELIVSDDGSTDRTADIVREMASRDSRIRLIMAEKNQGCYFARNRALRASRGKYIAIQDADDISLSDRLLKQLVPLCSGNALFTIGRVMRSNCTADELDPLQEDKMMELVLGRRAGDGSYKDRPILGLMTSMFHRVLFERFGLFWEHSFGADAEICERALFHLARKSFRDDGPNVHVFLSRYSEVPGIYKQIEEIVLISPQMMSTNITNSHSDEERKEFQTLWRKRLKGEIDYEYPVF